MNKLLKSVSVCLLLAAAAAGQCAFTTKDPPDVYYGVRDYTQKDESEETVLYGVPAPHVDAPTQHALSNVINVRVSGQIFYFVHPPVMKDDTTYVEARRFLEQLGYAVSYDAAAGTVTAYLLPDENEDKDSRSSRSDRAARKEKEETEQAESAGQTGEAAVVFKAGSSVVTLNGSQKDMGVEAEMIDETLFIPLRAVGTAMGYTVNWNQSTNTATLITGGTENE